ncbi:CLUMA_CG017268, isoform A [Clunio marinus]|uniref:CLUMA_CG017268, isoform A n=1 Tax=Clunio marinus TaxID=568069 RepID=A0A1J1IVC1_9DIPT|nr:CLUMA_CG017268, isoform A [Clunio marinus]
MTIQRQKSALRGFFAFPIARCHDLVHNRKLTSQILWIRNNKVGSLEIHILISKSVVKVILPLKISKTS